jgi:hypothetical protein
MAQSLLLAEHSALLSNAEMVDCDLKSKGQAVPTTFPQSRAFPAFLNSLPTTGQFWEMPGEIS